VFSPGLVLVADEPTESSPKIGGSASDWPTATATSLPVSRWALEATILFETAQKADSEKGVRLAQKMQVGP
jgi:hypothetical protein